jgi:hypothetical protein
MISAKYWRPLLGMLLIGLLLTTPADAAGPPLPLDAYWQKVQATQALIAGMTDMSSEASRAQLLAAAEQWAAIDEVQLPDGARVPVDHSFLVVQLRSPSPDPARLQELLASLLAASQTWPSHVFTGRDLNSLDPILARPEFQWRPGAPSPLAEWLDDLIRRALEFILRLLFDNGVVNLDPTRLTYLLTGLGVLVLGMVLVYIFRSLLGDLIVEAAAQQGDDAGRVALTADGALQQAHILAKEGDYRVAVRYLYLSALLTLDERELLRYDRARTNREVLNSVAHLPELAGLLRQVIDVFDRVWYGYQPLERAAYTQYAARVAELRRQK